MPQESHTRISGGRLTCRLQRNRHRAEKDVRDAIFRIPREGIASGFGRTSRLGLARFISLTTLTLTPPPSN